MMWLLLIYTIPSNPPGKRAAVWRDLKKCGAAYLRDGVAVLPESRANRAPFEQIAAKIAESGGQATIVGRVQLPADRENEIVAQGRDERAAELAELVQEVEGFLAYLDEERTHRTFLSAERGTLARNWGKLHAWAAQIRGRDHFGAAAGFPVRELLARCDLAIRALDVDAASPVGAPLP